MARGQVAQVWRGSADKFGDRNEVHIGTLNVILDPGTVDPDGNQREASEVQARMFASRRDPIKIKQRDRIKIAGDDGTTTTWQVTSPREFDHSHALTGHAFARYSVGVQAVV